MIAKYQIEFEERRHLYRVNGVLKDSTTQVLELLQAYKGVPDAVLKPKAEFGDNGHRMISFFIKGTLDETTVPPALRPHLERFKIWYWGNPLWEKGEPESEVRMFHPDLNKCGTADLLWGPELLDIKFGYWKEWYVGPQTACYAEMREAMFGVKTEKRKVLYPGVDGWKTALLDDKNDIRIFRELNKTYDLIKQWKGK